MFESKEIPPTKYSKLAKGKRKTHLYFTTSISTAVLKYKH